MLKYFGSEVNGLVSSLNQFLGYVSLLEGGITGILIANLYKPLYEGDNQKISIVLKTADRFYKKISLIITLYSIAVSALYPILFNTSFSYAYIMTLGLILSINYIIQYAVTLTFRSLLRADGRMYIISITQIAVIVITLILSYASVFIYPSVHIFKLISAVFTFAYPIGFEKYVSRYYSISSDVETDDSLLKNKWNGFSINLATFVHFSTDVAVLTVFTDLYIVSIYSIYYLVVSGIDSFIRMFCKSFTFAIGEAYAEGDKENLNLKFGCYESLVIYLLFVVITVSIPLITPFVMIYTKNVTDIDYYQPLFGLILLISESLYLVRTPHFELATSANRYKEMTIPSIIEALINVLLSVLFVKKYGLVGSALGTALAMLFGLIYQVFLTGQIISKERIIVFIKKITVYILTTLIALVMFNWIGEVKYNITSWISHALIYTSISVVMYYLLEKFIFRESVIGVYRKFKNHEDKQGEAIDV